MRNAARVAASAIVTVLASMALYVSCYQPLRALITERALFAATDHAEKVVSWQAPPLARDNLLEIERLRRWTPNDMQLALLAAANYRVLGRDEDVLRVLQEAVRAEQRPELYSELAAAELKLGRTALAEDHYAIAAAFNPAYLADIPNSEMAATVRKRADIR